MKSSLYNTKSYLSLNQNRLEEFDNFLDEESITFNVNRIRSLLLHVTPDKVDDITKIMIELMQNIVNYSAQRQEIQEGKYRSRGTFVLIADTQTDSYTIKCSNIITIAQKSIIQKKLQEIHALSQKELRKLKSEKMRSKRDVHDKGAGLGFIMMAMSVTKPLEVEFLPFKNSTLEYILTLYM